MAQSSELTFTEASNQLDSILEKFKTGQLSLEESLKLFEQGVSTIQVCHQHLHQAKGQVEVLIEQLSELDSEEDEVTTVSFEDDEE